MKTAERIYGLQRKVDYANIEKDKKIFTRYTTKNGMPDNLIFRILEDEKNNLFISTSKGPGLL